MFDIEAFCCRGSIFNFDGLEESVALDNLLAVGEADLCQSIVGCLLYDQFPVTEGLVMLQNGSVGGSAAVVCLEWTVSRGAGTERELSAYLDIVRVESNGRIGILDSKAVRFELDVGLEKSSISAITEHRHVACGLNVGRTWARLVKNEGSWS